MLPLKRSYTKVLIAAKPTKEREKTKKKKENKVKKSRKRVRLVIVQSYILFY